MNIISFNHLGNAEADREISESLLSVGLAF